MTTSNPYTLVDNIYGAGIFQTEFEVSNYFTVQKTPGISFSQVEFKNATSLGYTNDDGSINYVNVYGKGNYEQLGAPDEWMESLLNNPTYWNTIKESTGSGTANIGFDLAEEGTVLSSTNSLNTDANNNPTPITSATLIYPIKNTGNYDYLQITTYKRVSNITSSAVNNSGSGFDLKDPDELATQKTEDPVVILPMQPKISDSNSVDWGSDTLSPLQLVGARGASVIMENASSGKFGEAASEFFNVLKSAAGDALNDISETDIKAYFAGRAVGANIFTRATGKVINPNLELLFRGPNLRTFSYNYTFTPRDPDEARVVRSIIRHFKKNMAVRRSNKGLFLETPYIFDLKYIYAGGDQHPFLNKIKKCALTSFNVDYTPDGSYMTYKDGSMTSYSVAMQFAELSPIYAENYDKLTEDMGY